MARREIKAELIAADGLSAGERALWALFQSETPALYSPFFDYRYAQAAAAAAPASRIAVLHEAGTILGFFAFQRRGLAIHPLGAPLTDYHGAIAPADAALTPSEISRALGAQLRVSAWSGAAPQEQGWSPHQRRICDVSHGCAALNDALELRDRKYCKNLRRQQRAAERELGALQFEADDRDASALDWIIAAKRAQYRRTRRHDVFACGWTQEMLRALLACRRASGFGVRVATLRAGDGALIAAEASLDDGRVQHLWFPAYATAHARLGAGSILTRLQLEAAADAGYALVDFGCGGEAYKHAMTEAAGLVYAGAASPWPGVAQLSRAAAAAMPHALRRVSERAGRRLDIVGACETDALGWLAGAARAAQAALPRTA